MGDRLRAGFLAAALLLVGCGSASRPSATVPSTLDPRDALAVVDLTPQALATTLSDARITPDDRARVATFQSTVPEQPTPTAVITYRSLLGPEASGPETLAAKDGTATAHVLVVSLSPRPQTIFVACALNRRPMPCNGRQSVIRAVFPSGSALLVDLVSEAHPGDALAAYVTNGADPGQLEPRSSVLTRYVDHRPSVPLHLARVPTHPKVLGGCDLAALTTDARTSTTYRVPRPERRSALYLSVQFCAGQSHPVAVTAILNGHEVVPVILKGSTEVVMGRNTVIDVTSAIAEGDICSVQFTVHLLDDKLDQRRFESPAAALCPKQHDT